MPHYNAWEATACLKEKLGKYYMKSDENYWISMWKAARRCRVSLSRLFDCGRSDGHSLNSLLRMKERLFSSKMDMEELL
jgi:hypothetical protein